MKRVFYVLYLPHHEIQIHLDLMRILCDPLVTSPAHLTVRGPYAAEPLDDAIWKTTRNIQVDVNGVGQFFSEAQNTVFLKCSSYDLKRFWYKPQYKGFQPHITMYDGESRRFAEELSSILNRYDLSFSFVADRLFERESTNGQFSLGFTWSKYYSVLEAIGKPTFDRRTADALSEGDRLSMIDEVAKHLESVLSVQGFRNAGHLVRSQESASAAAVCTSRDRIFISHANPEDNDYTRWLSLRLITEGYPVWSDLVRLRGGEDFWRDIEEAIRTRTVKFLYVLSKTSNAKEGPLQELAVAKATAREHGFRDFIVPLHVDDLAYSEMNIELKRLTAISFENGWAKGLETLLSKLQEDCVPKDRGYSASVATSWWRQEFDANAGIVRREEECLSSWFPIVSLPENIYFHLLTGYTGSDSADVAAEPSYPVCSFGNGVFSFAKREDFQNTLINGLLIPDSHRFITKDLITGRHSRTFVNSRQARDIIVRLLSEGWRRMVLRRSLAIHEMANRNWCAYFVKDQVPKDRLDFDGVNGDRAHRYIMGYRTLRARDDERKLRHWHFGLSASPFLHPTPGFAIKGHVLFSDDGRQVWASRDRLNRARMNQCKNWWNDDWRDRILATMSWLAEGDDQLTLLMGSDADINVSKWPITFVSDVTFIQPVNADPPEAMATDLDGSEEEYEYEVVGDE